MFMAVVASVMKESNTYCISHMIYSLLNIALLKVKRFLRYKNAGEMVSHL